MNQKDKFYIPLIVALSIIIPLVVAGLMFLPEDLRISYGNADFRSLPFFHAVLNGSTAVLLLVGFVWIKNKKIALHRIAMMSAFILSAIFLVSYVVSKIVNPKHAGYEGDWEFIYYFILSETYKTPVLYYETPVSLRNVHFHYGTPVFIIKRPFSLYKTPIL